LDRPARVSDAERVEEDQSQSASAPVTGNPRLDAAMREVADLSGVDVSEHAARFEAVHDVMRDILNDPARGSA